MNNLAENVRRLRHAMGWSQEELIARAGVTSVKLIEVGRIQSPQYHNLESLARVLGVTVSDLYADPRRAKRKARVSKTVRQAG